MTIQQASKEYAEAGLCVLPIKNIASKRPNIPGGWKQYQSKRPTEVQRNAMFRNAVGICVICGGVSGGVEFLDFDNKGEQFSPWLERLEKQAPKLWQRLVCEKTPSGGYHVIYRCKKYEGNQKLSQRKLDNVNNSIEVLIETRGNGGLCLCAPTKGYELIHNTITNIPEITEDERKLLFNIAKELSPDADMRQKPAEQPPKPIPRDYTHIKKSNRIGDDFTANGNVEELLKKHGWKYLYTNGENQMWQRPGKEEGVSATYNGEYFYCHTSSTCLEPATAYNPFSLFAALECDNDFSAAAKELRKLGYGKTNDLPDQTQFIMQNSSDFQQEIKEAVEDNDPGDFPKNLLDVPGFIGDVIQFNLKEAYRPQKELACLGALSLLSILTAQKITDNYNTRTNLYLLGLMDSGEGKDRARQVNKQILAASAADQLVPCEEISSDTSIIRWLKDEKKMLLQLDEFGRFLTSMNNKSSAHLYKIAETFLKLYSCANGVFSGRMYADMKDRIEAIKEPFLTVYGTTVPDHFWNGLNKDNLSDGLFSRLLVLEGKMKEFYKKPKQISNIVPESIISQTKKWLDFIPQDEGNIHSVAETSIVTAHYTNEAQEYLDQRYYDWMKGRLQKDSFERAMLNRNEEKARKLALLYSSSEQGTIDDLQIHIDAIKWACEFVDYSTQLMIYKADLNVSENRREKDTQDMQRFIESKREEGVTLTQIARKYRRLTSTERNDIIHTLCEDGTLVLFKDDGNQSRGQKKTKIISAKHFNQS